MKAEQIAEALWPHVPETNWVRWVKAVERALGAEEVLPRSIADDFEAALKHHEASPGIASARHIENARANYREVTK